MNHTVIRIGIIALLLAVLGLRSASVSSDPTFTAGAPPSIAQIPLYMRDAVPPLNMLVMGKDHKIYYEAYNDASDLNGDGVLDVGYRGWELKNPAPTDGSSLYKIDYYGYFNSYACYNWDGASGGRFVAVATAPNKQCIGQWSGDFLNYLTMSRMDTLRRVLYGGWRHMDRSDADGGETVLQGAYFPQDAHSWGKEYASAARDGYDIRNYAPVGLPDAGRYHLFAVTTITVNSTAYPNYQAPLFRVLRNSPYRVWNWLSIEGPVAGNKCFNVSNQRVNCVSGGTPQPHPGHPGNRAAYDTLVTNHAIPANFFGTSNVDRIDCTNNACNLQGADDNYLTLVTGSFTIASGGSGNYEFAINGADAVDFQLRIGSINGTIVAGSSIGCYGDRNLSGGNGCATTGNLALSAGTTYYIRFRHETAAGNDGYQLRWRKRSGSNQFNYGIMDIDDSASGNLSNTSGRTFSYEFYNLSPIVGASPREDYLVRVQACPDNAALRDATCKTYPAGTHKPTGILHDYGENQRMFFGLITGSQRNNLHGGQLRRNIADFATEINTDDGTFNNVEGIVRSIDRLRMIGGDYGFDRNREALDQNWNWANGNGSCPSIGDRPIDNGECRMWGNPIAEMLYEGLRYFAGADAPTPQFSTGGNTAGNEDTALGLPEPGWQDPYGTTEDGLNYPACAKPNQTIISDINPSYDGDLPGSAFAGAIPLTGDTPANIAGFNAATEGQDIWNAEPGLGGTRNVFIGEVVGTATDGAPTAKSASSFGNIRGLSPEEPTKGGTYYSASVSRFGRNTDLNARPGSQSLNTYSIALASPLPRIEFPVGEQTVTLLPFAKTVSGTFGGGTRKPTNTIVDFYVESFANFPGQPINTTINGGRPSAIFRINYEDVEQGNDHDMDSIVRYEVLANADGRVTINLTSEYAAGSANQNVGYVMSGTTQDGIYLEVRDSDAPTFPYENRDGYRNGYLPYDLNTPPGYNPGGCAGLNNVACGLLPLTASRTFTPGTAASGTQLKNPLWYAAKYGSPDPANWDVDRNGEPDNYFLVSNPLNLREQLSRAFDDIADRGLDVENGAISGARVQSGSFTLQPTFARNRDGKDWIGDVSAKAIYPDGTLADGVIWSARSELAALGHASRNIRTITAPGSGTRATRAVAEFQDTAALGTTNDDRLGLLGINPTTVSSLYGASYTSGEFIDYLRGNQAREASVGGATNTLRERSFVLGDIVNSEPVVASPRSDFGYGNYSDTMFSGYANTGTGGYLFDKRSRRTMVYVGANDGMLHAFDASTTNCPADDEGRVIACPTGTSGEELFAFIPNGVLGNLGKLPLPDNNFEHRYFVDGQITLGDAKDGSTWKTLLVGSAGAGGRTIFALDVSNIDSRSSFGNTNVLWERNSRIDNDIGHIYGKPLLVPLENDRWGVLFGNGYGGNASDPSLYILDAFTGAVIKKITGNDGNQAANPNPIADFICQAFGGFEWVASICARRVAAFNGLGQITAIDRTGNGKVDTVYGGDQQGNLWKFDLRSTSDAAWNVYNFATGGQVPLFTAETGSGATAERQPITGGIRVAAGPGAGVMVYFGTGRYFISGDNDVPATPQIQSLYAIFDNGPRTDNAGSSPAVSRANLVAQTVTAEGTATVNGVEYTTRNISRNPVAYFGSDSSRGWYLDLKLGTAANGDGERFIATPRIQSGRVFFTTYEPTEDEVTCSPGGINFQYGLDLLSGAGAINNLGVLPTGDAVCTNAGCGGVQIRGSDGSETMPPITNTGVVAINPVSQIDPTCNPAVTGSCPTFEECQVVIYPGAFVLPRPCGRQSWRQLK